MQKQTEYKLHLKHVCSPCGSPQSSEVNAEHAETLLEALSAWILLLSTLFIYLNSVRTSHLPSFLFNLQETKKNTSGFLCCVDPVMCRAVTPGRILLVIVEAETPKSSAGHSGLLSWHKIQTQHQHWVITTLSTALPTPALGNYHSVHSPPCVQDFCTSHHYFSACEKRAWAPKQSLQQTTQRPQHQLFETILLLDFPFWYNQNKISQWLLFGKFCISLLLLQPESWFLITLPYSHSNKLAILRILFWQPRGHGI